MPVNGMPLIAHTIAAALRARTLARVVVSSDDAEILSVAAAWGAETLVRPPELATDEASSESAMLHALDEIERRSGALPEVAVMLQCTSPLTTPEHIDGLVAALLDEGADSALTVRPTHAFLWRRDAGGDAVGVNHDRARRPRRQDREAEFIETGAAYAFRTEPFRRGGHRFFGRVALFETPDAPPLEIDDPEDVRMVEAFLRGRDARG